VAALTVPKANRVMVAMNTTNSRSGTAKDAEKSKSGALKALNVCNFFIFIVFLLPYKGLLY
jgi:hypothetical protein